jgi:hypothetical protein
MGGHASDERILIYFEDRRLFSGNEGVNVIAH